MKASIIIPVYNEEENVAHCCEELKAVLERLPGLDAYELVFTDNCSTDRTFEILATLHAADPRIRVFRFSKNFGYQRSILEGYRKARGDFAIQIDCDLQDPLELIPVFVNLWKEGAKVVYGIRRRRKESLFLELLRKVFYRLVTFLSGGNIPPDAGDFRLIDRVILDALASYHDESPYLRGKIANLGFRQIGVPYDRNARQKGNSKFSFLQLLLLAADGIVSSSVTPLRLATLTAVLMSFVTAGMAVYYFGGKLFFGQTWPAGFTTLTLLLLFSISLSSLFFGIMGEYVARIFRQLKLNESVVIEAALDRKPI